MHLVPRITRVLAHVLFWVLYSLLVVVIVIVMSNKALGLPSLDRSPKCCLHVRLPVCLVFACLSRCSEWAQSMSYVANSSTYSITVIVVVVPPPVVTKAFPIFPRLVVSTDMVP